MDITELSMRLASLALKNTATEISDKIKASKNDQETIRVLEQIINDLLSDKNKLNLIAQTYEEEFVSQKISDKDIEYIIHNLVPVLRSLMYKSAAINQQQAENVDEIMEIIEPLLSTETLNVLQLLGFNFKKAIGEPLTRLVRSAIDSKHLKNPSDSIELQKMKEEKETQFYKMINNEESYERYFDLMST